MSSYTRSDFSESLDRGTVIPTDIECVIAAWGNVDRDGACCDACGGEWSGGFLLRLKDQRYAYLTGWCDYTGWGCQDGANVAYYETEPSLSDLEEFSNDRWDLAPKDLNDWIRDGAKSDKIY
jgi:hypothetical protein